MPPVLQALYQLSKSDNPLNKTQACFCIWPCSAPGQVRPLWPPGFQLQTHMACIDMYLIQPLLNIISTTGTSIPISRHVRPVKLTWPGVTYLACNSGHVRRLTWPQGLTWLVTASPVWLCHLSLAIAATLELLTTCHKHRHRLIAEPLMSLSRVAWSPTAWLDWQTGKTQQKVP